MSRPLYQYLGWWQRTALSMGSGAMIATLEWQMRGGSTAADVMLGVLIGCMLTVPYYQARLKRLPADLHEALKQAAKEQK